MKILASIQKLLCIILLPTVFSNLDDYVDSFSQHFELFESKEQLKLSLKPFSFTIDKFRAVRKSTQKEIKANLFIFFNNLYTYVFDLTIIADNNIKIIHHEQIINYNIKRLTFQRQLDGTMTLIVEKSFQECEYHLSDLFKYSIFSKIKKGIVQLCSFLTDFILLKINNFVQFNCINNHRLNLEDFIYKITQKTEILTTDYILNSTHTVLDLTFDNISFSNQKRMEEWSSFSRLCIEFSYTVINSRFYVDIRKDFIIFSDLTFGEDKMNYSRKVIRGDLQFVPLIEKYTTEFEKKRQWQRD